MKMRIAIAGGGLGGLTLARILRRHDIDVVVYEREASRSARSQGGMLDLHPESGQQALAEAGRVNRATEVFERAAAYANDVGLLAEEIDPHTGELLGNFPQAFSHIGLVTAAWAISEARQPIAA